MSFYIRVLFFIVSVFAAHESSSQGQAIGQWRSHLPYNRVGSIATNGSMLFVACNSSFFTHDLISNETTTYSKVNGMSDVDLHYIAHDNVTEMTVLAYNNSNIDLFKDNNFYNIPDLKLKSIAGDKKIYHIHIENGLAYLSTGVGIIVIDLTKREIKETYVFTENKKNFAVKGFSSDANHFYAATDNGFYRILKTSKSIQASASWSLLDSGRAYTNTVFAANKIFASTTDSVFVWHNDSITFTYTRDSSIVTHIDSGENSLLISTFNNYYGAGKIIVLNDSYKIIDSLNAAYPKQAVSSLDNHYWVADAYSGVNSNKQQQIIPNGPFSIGSYDILTDNGKVYIAHGSYDDRWNASDNRDGVSIYENDQWNSYNTYFFSPFTNLKDAVRLAKDPSDNTLYVASQLNGLFFLKTDKSGGQIKEGVFETHILDPSTYRLSGVAFDLNNNLWVTQTNAPHELMARSAKDGNWYKFGLFATRPRPFWANGAAGLIIDDYNQKWFFSPAGGGVLVYDDKNTLEDVSDDEYIKLVNGKGAGNLPDNLIQCIVNDKKGSIWIGTNNGIGIINCPEQVIARQCEAEIRVVQYDNFAGELFAGENVKTIAVDGANRKWIGTGNGVWLISEDAGKIINRFTAENSPLPSNNIQTIKVEPKTGEVYIGTDKGLVSYRSTATDGGEANKDVVIFPNPVKGDYSGTIAIKGLVNNADVRITDISGQLIYRTKALGGQAVWNGTDYTGRRPQSGVFLVFATDNLGTERFAGKMVFIKK